METFARSFWKLLYTLFGILFYACILIGLLSLGKFLYSYPLPSASDKEKKQNSAEEMFSKSIREPIGADHFHILDETVYTDIENAPMCLRCHGNFCHTKSAKYRAYYNMHTFFMACEVCHIRPDESQHIIYQWFSDQTGKIVKIIKGTNGNYGAKIVPVVVGESGLNRLDTFPQTELALSYLDLKDVLSDDEKQKMQHELMKHISDDEITCGECHSRPGFLDYRSLGYTKRRRAELSTVGIVKMFREYNKFHLPALLKDGSL